LPRSPEIDYRPLRNMKVPVLIVHAPGTNRDREAAEAFSLAGAKVDIVALSALLETPARISGYRLVCLPGGFSFGDALGSGRMLGLALARGLSDMLGAHIARGRPVLGICNGFQALLKGGFIAGGPSRVTLTRNLSGRFECRMVTLAPTSNPSPWLSLPGGPIRCPVAHAEGRLVGDSDLLRARAALRYVPTGDAPEGYPGNPNGSPDHIAGLVDETGLVLGLMPHPEDHIHAYQGSPHSDGGSGLSLFRAGVALASSV
jgi:phosphoribosylformylglycinamidine synthase